MMPWLESFHRPANIEDALRAMQHGGRHARFVGGGTELLVQSDPAIKVLVDVTRLKLAFVRARGNGLAIGAATTLAEIEGDKVIRRLAGGILSRAAMVSAPIQIRNRATIGGILATASPAADLFPALLALDAEVVLIGRQGRRRMPLGEFFLGPRETAANGALITEVFIPAVPHGRAAWSYRKLGNTERDLAIVNVAAGLGLDRQGRTRWARIALGAVAPTPLRIPGAEQFLEGKPPTAALLDQAARMAGGQVRPVSDIRASAAYRRQMSQVMVRRALTDCVAQLGRTQ